MKRYLVLACAIVTFALGAVPALARAAASIAEIVPLNVQVSHSSAISGASHLVTDFREVMLAIDPADPDHLLGTGKFPFWNATAHLGQNPDNRQQIFGALAPVSATPSNLSIDWWTMDGGGGTSSGGSYSLAGTIGQADTGKSIAASYTLSGGFWFSSDFGVSPYHVYLPLVIK